jgi:hypothetical protein
MEQLLGLPTRSASGFQKSRVVARAGPAGAAAAGRATRPGPRAGVRFGSGNGHQIGLMHETARRDAVRRGRTQVALESAYVPGVLRAVQLAPPSSVRWIAPRTVAYATRVSPNTISGAIGAACE